MAACQPDALVQEGNYLSEARRTLLNACQGATPKISVHRSVCREGAPTNRAMGALGPEPQNFLAQSGAKNYGAIEMDLKARPQLRELISYTRMLPSATLKTPVYRGVSNQCPMRTP